MEYTIEYNIKRIYGLPTTVYLEECLEKKMTIRDISKELGCSVSNLRRIARKHQFKFYRPEPTPKFIEVSQFKSKGLNLDNILSKGWVIRSKHIEEI